MSEIVPFKAAELPAEIAGYYDVDSIGDDLSAGASGGFAVLSIRGSKWRIKHGGEETPVLDEETEEPKPSIEVVMLKASPEISKIFYKKSFVEGDAEEPDCFSLDGVTPDPSSKDIQAEKCAACPNAVWGSKITEAGKKAKLCQDNRRVAVVPAGDLKNETFGGPMLLRVPAASLADLASFGKKMKAKGFPYNTVVTRLGFDMDASYPKLTFKAVRMLKKEEIITASQHYSGDVLTSILSNVPVAVPDAVVEPDVTPTVDVEFEEAPEPAAAAPSKREKPTPKPKAAKAKEVPAPAAEATPSASVLDEELDDILNDLTELA